MPHLPKGNPKKWVARKPNQKSSGHQTRRTRDEDDKFYNTTPWRKLRAKYISEHPLCLWCDEEGRTTQGKVVDHITQIKMGGDRLNEENLQTLCTPCHAKKSAYEAHNKKKSKQKGLIK